MAIKYTGLYIFYEVSNPLEELFFSTIRPFSFYELSNKLAISLKTATSPTESHLINLDASPHNLYSKQHNNISHKYPRYILISMPNMFI